MSWAFSKTIGFHDNGPDTRRGVELSNFLVHGLEGMSILRAQGTMIVQGGIHPQV